MASGAFPWERAIAFCMSMVVGSPRRRTHAFEPLGARNGSGMALSKQASCSSV